MENSRNHQPPTPDAAAADLAFLRSDGATAASAAAAPTWYHLIQSLCVAGFVMAFALPMSWFITAICATAAIYTILGFLRPRFTRVQTSPWERGPSRRAGLQLLAILLVVGVGGVALYTISGQLWILLVAAGLAFGATFYLSQRMEKAFSGSFAGGK